MGSFRGHALPGSFFIVFGVWWTIQISIRYFKAIYWKGPAYKSTLTFPCSCLCGKLGTWPIEGLLKIIVTTIGCMGEIWSGFHGTFAADVGNGQHATMYFIFGISGLVDIIQHHCVVLPKNSDYIVSIVAFAIECILFKFHLYGRSAIDVEVHVLLVYAVEANILMLLAEMHWPRSVLCAYARAYFVLLQGTWFWQIAFILYDPLPGATKWDGDDNKQRMLTIIIFSWHMIIILISMMITSFVICCVIRRHDPVVAMDTSAYLMKKEADGQAYVCLSEESESDIEIRSSNDVNETCI